MPQVLDSACLALPLLSSVEVFTKTADAFGTYFVTY
jgi:hypothetical protein